jgi:hypothetical protein
MISWLQSFFDNFSDFTRINIFLIIILFVSFMGGWALNNFDKYE